MKFIEILQEYNIEIAPENEGHNTTGWIGFDCPYCGPESRKFHMGFNIAGGYVNCWKCGGHSLGDTIQMLLHDYESNAMCYKITKAILDDLDIDLVKYTKHKTKRTKVVVPFAVSILLMSHRNYLTRRGFNPEEIIKLWKVGGTEKFTPYEWRLFIPIFNQGQMVSWDTRAIGSKITERYIAAPAECEVISRKNILYGSDYARDTIIVVEGYTDVWRIGPGAVATMGIAYTPEQVLEISKYKTRYILFDNEPVAQKQASKLCCELAVFTGKTIRLELDMAKDPDTADQRTIIGLKGLLR